MKTETCKKKRRPPFNLRYPVLLSAAAICGTVIGTYFNLTAALLIMSAAVSFFLIYSVIFNGSKAAVILFTVVIAVFYFYSFSMLSQSNSKSTVSGGFNGDVIGYQDNGNGSCTLAARGEVNGKEQNVSIYVSGYVRGMYHYGDRIYTSAVLNPLKQRENEYSYDSRNYYISQRIYYTAYADSYNIAVLGNKTDFLSPFWQARETIDNNLRSALPADDAALISAMLLGMDENLSDETSGLFRDLGVAHIFSVSGLHVGIIVAALNLLLILCRLCRKGRLAVISVFLMAYCAITAFSPSIVRASVMTFIMLLAGVFKRRYDSLCALGAAALLILAVNPYNVYSVGFQLSFLACLGIIAFGNIVKVRNKAANYVVSSLNITLAAQLPCLPVMANAFGSISFISPIANLLIVPVAGLTLLLALPLNIICLIIPSAHGIISCLVIFTSAVRYAAKAVACIGPNLISVAALGIAPVTAYYLILLFSSRYYAVKLKTRILSCACVLVLTATVVFGGYLHNSNTAEVAFLSVGNGDCTVVTAGSECYVIDTGTGDYTDSGLGNRGYTELRRYLKANGIRRINVILTHGDSDHSGGLICLMQNNDVEIDQIFYNPITAKNKYLSDEMDQWGSATIVESGDHLSSDSGISFDFLYPNGLTPAERNVSLAFIMSYGDCRILFCGDNEQADGDIISQENISCDIMLLPHHGSPNTESKKLIEKASPEIFIISSGTMGEQDGSNTFVTASSGQITLRIPAQGQYTVKENKK